MLTELLHHKNIVLLRGALAHTLELDELLVAIVRPANAHAIHAYLERSAAFCAQVGDGELAAEVVGVGRVVGLEATTGRLIAHGLVEARHRLLHRLLDREVQLAALFRVELAQLRLAVALAPQAQDLGLGTVGHVDELLEPPALMDLALDAAQDHAVVAHLHEEDLGAGVRAGVHGKRLLLHETAARRPQVDVVAGQVADAVEQLVDLLTHEQADVRLAEHAAYLAAYLVLAHLHHDHEADQIVDHDGE